MTLWKSIDLTSLFNGESSWAVTTLKILEAVDRDSARSGCELQETTLLLRVPRSNDLPEVLNNFVLLLVTAVVRVFLPVVNVDVSDTANKQLELALVKDIDEIGRNQFVETCYESIKLFFDPFGNLPLGDKPGRSQHAIVKGLNDGHSLNIFSLVLVRNRDVTSTWFQINRFGLSKLLVFDRERLVEDVGDVVLQSPRQILVILFVDTLHISDVDFLSQHHLVKRANKERVQETAMENGEADHTANKLEVVEMFWVDA